MNQLLNPPNETYSVKQIESALRCLVAASVKVKRNPGNSRFTFGELRTDVNVLTCLLRKARSGINGFLCFHDADNFFPKAAYWIRRGMIETGPVRNIFYVDSQPFLHQIISSFISNQGYKVESTDKAEEALLKIEPDRHELVILDNGLPGMGWAGIAGKLRERDYPGKIILMTSDLADDEISVCQKLCVDKILHKPIGCSDLLSAILTITRDKPRNVLPLRTASRLRSPLQDKRNRS